MKGLASEVKKVASLKARRGGRARVAASVSTATPRRFLSASFDSLSYCDKSEE